MTTNQTISPQKTSSEIIETFEISKLLEKLNTASPKTTIFLDVDDTLITPASKIFRSLSPFRALIDNLKKNKTETANFEEILGRWRLKRKTILVSEQWPKIIQSLISEGKTVYGLTQMDTGSVGPIPSIEEWRYQELRSKEIHFCKTFNQKTRQLLLNSDLGRHALFYHGIFMTGSFSKSEVVSVYLKETQADKIIFIDDRETQVLDLAKFCENYGIPYLGIIFRGIDLLPEVPDPIVADLQIKSLFNFLEWLEDDEAEKKLSEKY